MGETSSLENAKWVVRMKAFGILAGALTAIFALCTALSAAGVPMPVLSNRLVETHNNLDWRIKEIYILQAQAEIDARNRIDRSNQILLFEMNSKIEEMRRNNAVSPSAVEQLTRHRLEIEDNIKQRDRALQRIEMNQKR